MKNPSKPRPLAQVVNSSKKFIVALGVLALVGGAITIVSGEIAAGVGIVIGAVWLFITGGIVAGLSVITQAAEVYIEKEIEQWEQEQARAKAEQEQAEDEVIDYLVDMVK